MIDLHPKQYIKHYDALRRVIDTYRLQPHEDLLRAYAFHAVPNEADDGQHDQHIRQRMALMLTLSADYNESDRPLIRWLIRENSKLYHIGFDISQETALCAFMLYKFMAADDVMVLYACKFAYGCSEQHTVDTEIALGFGLQETLDYLDQHHHMPICLHMKQEIEHYCANGVRFKPREQFIDFFENRRFAYLQEQVADCYGFIDLNDL